MNTIVFYASSTGNTQAAAEYLAARLGGNAVPFASADRVDLNSVDTAVFGSRVHAGGIHKGMCEYVKNHQTELSGCRTAYFVCGLFDGDRADRQCRAAGESLGIETGCWFRAAKKALKNGDTEKFDRFAELVESL